VVDLFAPLGRVWIRVRAAIVRRLAISGEMTGFSADYRRAGLTAHR